MKKFIPLFIVLVILTALSGNIMSYVEQPDYTVVASKDNFEIRDYSPMIIAEVEVPGDRKEAIQKGFRILADYIFGNNTVDIKGDLPEKLAMTAPVMQEKDSDQWKVRFVMPKKYTLENLPKPKSNEVRLIPVPARRFAAIRFSGLADQENINQAVHSLENYIKENNLNTHGEFIYAFYNPPWTIPFLRRNEVMIEITKND